MSEQTVKDKTMLLEDFIKKSGMKKKAFAAEVKISTTNLWKILKGITRPSLRTAQRIEEFTQGQVSMQELLFRKASTQLHLQPPMEKRISELEYRIRKLESLVN